MHYSIEKHLVADVVTDILKVIHESHSIKVRPEFGDLNNYQCICNIIVADQSLSSRNYYDTFDALYLNASTKGA
jgi:hypothetical protein